MADTQAHEILGRMKRLAALAALVLLSLPTSPAFTQPVGTLPPVSTITFAPGSTVSTVNGQMAPGGRDLYYVPAKAGQTMLVSITSAADIAFQVYTPETTLAKGADGSPVVNGATLPNAGPAANAKAWVGAIPRDGNYLITVGSAGGGPPAPTPHSLTVSLQ